MTPVPPPVDLRLAVPAAAGWLALVLVLPLEAPQQLVALLTLASIVVLAGAVALRSAGRPRAVASVAALVLLAAGVASVVVGAALLRADARWPAAVTALEGHVAVVEGTVGERVTPASRSTEMTMTRLVAGEREAWRGASSVVLLGPRVEGPPVETGTRVRVRASVLPVSRGDPTPFLAAARGPLEPTAPPAGADAAAHEVRAAFRSATEGLPGDGGALLPGLTLGDTSGVPDDLGEAMATASLTHLTAVSGSNCAVLVALTMLVGGALRVPRLVRIGVAAVVLLAFLLLVTPDASILRATVMALVVLVHLAAARPVSGLPVAALAVTGLLIADPWLARDVGFALSVLATVGLVVLARPLAALLGRVLPTPVALLLAVPAAAQLSCQPVLLALEPSIPVHGVVANVLAEPAAPVATVAGLVVCATAPWAPELAEGVARVAWAPAAWVGAVARSVASWPLARVPWPDGAAGIAALVALSALVAAAVLARRDGRSRRVLAAAVVGGLVVVGGVAVGARVGGRAAVPVGWTVAQCDVGQGDAVLVRSRGATALIDTGDDEEALVGCLDRLGVHRVDLLVLTHFDADHVGAVGVVAGMTTTALVGPTGRPSDAAVVEELVDGGARVQPVAAGSGGVLGDLGWSVLWPIDPGVAGNDASVVTEWRPLPGCTAGCLSMLALGDLGESAQRRLLARSTVEPVDVVKVSHHGSADQHAELYRRASPDVALVGVGADNGYGHPTEEALRIVAETGAVVTRTDTDGESVVLVDDRADGGEARQLRVWRRGGAGGRRRRGGGDSPRRRPRVVSEGSVTLEAGLLLRGRTWRRTVAAKATGKTAKKSAVAIDQVAWHQIRPAPMLLVSGPEQFLADRAVRQLRDQLTAEDPSLEENDLEADHYQPGELISLASPSLFAEPRLIRVANVEKCTDAFLTETLRYLEAPADDTYVVLRHGGGVRGKKLLDALRGGLGGAVEVVCAELKKDTEKLDFAAAEFSAERRRITPGALRALVTAFNDDLAELASACQQLISDAAAEITEATVEKYYAGRVETNAFKVADMAIAGRQGEALVLLRHALSSGADPVPVVAAFAMKVRTMAKVQGSYGPAGQLASRFGMAPWQVERAQRDVRGWSEDGLGRCIELIAETDAAVKGAERDAIYALERMVTAVATRGSLAR